MTVRLPPLEGRWIEWLRTGPPVPLDARARVRARLEAGVPSMRREGGARGGPADAGGGATSHASPGLALAAFVAGGFAGAALSASLARLPADRIVYVERPMASLAPTAFSVAPSPEPPPRAGALSPTVVVPGSRPTPATPGSSRAPGQASRLSAEQVLLDDARSALVQGEPERALARLDEHRRRFPDGLLAEERDAMEVEALVRARRYEQARVRADDFRRRRPLSLFSATVEAAIAPAP